MSTCQLSTQSKYILYAPEPPVSFLHCSHRHVVIHDILKEAFNFRNQEGKIRDAGCLNEVAF